jgi:hypothetical protein
MILKLNKTFLVQLFYLSLTGITAIQKILPLEIPSWFNEKFEKTIGMIPCGIELSFFTITFLESLIAVLILFSIIKMEFKFKRDKPILKMALELSMILFLILFFGSFLAMDYENGALDFLYFAGTFYFHNTIENNEITQ